MKRQLYHKSKFQEMVRTIFLTEQVSDFGSDSNIPEAEKVASAQWGSLYGVMLKGEKNGETVYRVTLHSPTGPVKYLKQDRTKKWFVMNPPEQVWRPAKQLPVAAEEPVTEDKSCTGKLDCKCKNCQADVADYEDYAKKKGNFKGISQSELDPTDAIKFNKGKTSECSTCGCGDPTHDHRDDMKGDTTDVRTMDAVNVAEALDYRHSDDEIIKAYSIWKKMTPADTRSHNAVAFTAGWNAAISKAGQSGMNEGDHLRKKADLQKVLDDLKNKKTNYSDRWTDDDERALKKMSDEWDSLNKSLKEMTVTGDVAGYQTPFAFSKKSGGSPKATAASEKIGYKKVKKPY